MPFGFPELPDVKKTIAVSEMAAAHADSIYTGSFPQSTTACKSSFETSIMAGKSLTILAVRGETKTQLALVCRMISLILACGCDGSTSAQAEPATRVASIATIVQQDFSMHITKVPRFIPQVAVK
jgi:hypothetical protein